MLKYSSKEWKSPAGFPPGKIEGTEYKKTVSGLGVKDVREPPLVAW